MPTHGNLRLLGGCQSRDGATQLEETLRKLQRQLAIRSNEGFKKEVSLRAGYSDHFAQGVKMTSQSLDGPVWKLSCRFAPGSYTILSLQVVFIFLYRSGNSNFIIRYHVTDSGYAVMFMPTTKLFLPDDIFEKNDGWIAADTRFTYEGKSAVMFSPQWLFLVHQAESEVNLFPVILKFFERIVRNVEHYGRYNFLFRVGGSRQYVQSVSIDDIAAELEDA
jgi:hypothetical protein